MNKINACYNISSKIIDEYNKLREIILVYGIASEQFKKTIKVIIEFVKDEYITYRQLDSKNMVYNEIAKLLEIETSDITPCQNRFSYKIFNASIIADLLDDKHSIELVKLLPTTEMPSCMSFNVEDILCYMFEVEAFLKLGMQLVVLNNSDTLNKAFLSELSKLHDKYKFEYFTVRSSSEIISLYYEFDINKYPKIDYYDLIYKLSEKYEYKTEYTKKYLENKLVIMAKDVLRNLSRFENLSNDTETYYKYILYLTLLECYISNLEYNHLKELLIYIEELNVKNNNIKEDLSNILTKKKK